MTFTARSIHPISSAGNAGRVGYAKTKTIAIVIAALCCAVWLGGCKDSTSTTGEAAAPQAEAATSTAPAAPVNPLLAMAQVEPGTDGQPPRLTLYGLTLDAPLPDYPECTDDMLWQRNAPGPCFFPNDKRGEQRPVSDLVGELGGVIYPRKMIDVGYPYAVTVGFDMQSVQYMRISTDGREFPQGHYLEMVRELLGEPALLVNKVGERVSADEKAPDGIPLGMWFEAGDGAVLAIWETDYAWARYIGKYRGESLQGYLEIGSKRILRNGQLPDW